MLPIARHANFWRVRRRARAIARHSVKSLDSSSIDWIFSSSFYEVILEEVEGIFRTFTPASKSEAMFNKFMFQNNDVIILMLSKIKLEDILGKKIDGWFKEFEKHALIRLWFIFGVADKSDSSIKDHDEELNFQSVVDNQEHEKIRYSVGWVFKRIRETVTKAKSLSLCVKVGEPNIQVDKQSVLDAIASFVMDNRTDQNSYQVIPVDSHITDFFVKDRTVTSPGPLPASASPTSTGEKMSRDHCRLW